MKLFWHLMEVQLSIHLKGIEKWQQVRSVAKKQISWVLFFVLCQNLMRIDELEEKNWFIFQGIATGTFSSLLIQRLHPIQDFLEKT